MNNNNKADLVLKNAFIVNVFNQKIETSDIAIKNGKIIGIGEYTGTKIIDCTGKYVSPGFIDSHVHIESSKVIPKTFSHLLIKRGVTTCIADPHEIANVLGTEGINFMIKNSKEGIIDTFFMMPSCVPAVDFEDNGYTLKAKDLSAFVNDKRVLGLGEVMDVQAVVNEDPDMIEKLNLFKDKCIDGHCPKIEETDLDKYVGSGIITDHECISPEEVNSKIKRGMYIMLRHGSAAKNLENLTSTINESTLKRFLFCTDDKDIEQLYENGSIDECIRVSIKNGIDPVQAIIIATLNVVECYGLKNVGAIAPGYKADLVIMDDLENINITNVIKNGKIYNDDLQEYNHIQMKNTVNLNKINKEAFKIKATSDKVHVIKTIENSIETKKVVRGVVTKDGYVDNVVSDDILKIGVFERHKNTGKHSIGFIEGLGLKKCSVAQTIAHDSHNIIVIGNNDEDMSLAVNRLIDIQGGIVIVLDGKVIEELSLPIGGLMTFEDPKVVISSMKKLNDVYKTYGTNKDFDLFLTLGFMALPVISELRITARGLYDFDKSKFIDLFVSN